MRLQVGFPHYIAARKGCLHASFPESVDICACVVRSCPRPSSITVSNPQPNWNVHATGSKIEGAPSYRNIQFKNYFLLSRKPPTWQIPVCNVRKGSAGRNFGVLSPGHVPHKVCCNQPTNKQRLATNHWYTLEMKGLRLCFSCARVGLVNGAALGLAFSKYCFQKWLDTMA